MVVYSSEGILFTPEVGTVEVQYTCARKACLVSDAVAWIAAGTIHRIHFAKETFPVPGPALVKRDMGTGAAPAEFDEPHALAVQSCGYSCQDVRP
jgi:hypothetical protein